MTETSDFRNPYVGPRSFDVDERSIFFGRDEEIAILVGWFSLLLLSNHVRNNGADNALDELVASVEPRAYFYGGLVFHLAALVLVRLVPAGALEGGDVAFDAAFGARIEVEKRPPSEDT